VIADYLGEEFEALKRACEAIDRPDAVEIIEIAAPAVAGARPKGAMAGDVGWGATAEA
jgi:hypothetical protein